MEIKTKEYLVERYSVLTPKLKALVDKPNLADTIRIIAEKHHLPEEKIISLENEVMMVLLAFEDLSGFDERLVSELLIPGSVATSISRDIDTMIFKEVDDELTQIYRDREQFEKDHPELVPPSSPATRLPEAPPIRTLYEQSHPPTLTTPPQPPRPVAETPRYGEDPYRETI